jgi:hypothetical protein
MNFSIISGWPKTKFFWKSQPSLKPKSPSLPAERGTKEEEVRFDF